jgi:PAS domain S-box-containing protein
VRRQAGPLRLADELATVSPLTPDAVLEDAESAIVVTDRLGNLQYANAFAAGLFGFPDDPRHLTGRSLLSLGFEEGDLQKASELEGQVLGGHAWEGTFAILRGDGSRVFVRAQACRCGRGRRHHRHRDHGPRGDPAASLREREQIKLLERIGERLSGSLELGATLRHVAETLVPQFADHCLIDLLRGDRLVRQMQLHSRGWMPQPGTWAQVGEQITYPPGHFCQQAMTSMQTVIVADIGTSRAPAPSAASLATCDDVGLRSVIAAPLIVRGSLLGVMSLALSALTEREEPAYGPEDAGFLSAIASRVAIAIDNAMLFEEERRTALAFQTSLLPDDPPPVDGLEVAYKYVPAAAGRSRAGHPDPGRRRLVRHHPAVRGPGRHRHRGRRGPRRAGRGDHGPAAGRAARVRPGRQAARGDPAAAG